MWDNRLTKRNPKAPDYKCRDRNCDGVVWPPRPGNAAGPEHEGEAEQAASQAATQAAPVVEEKKPARKSRAAAVTADEIPF